MYNYRRWLVYRVVSIYPVICLLSYYLGEAFSAGGDLKWLRERHTVPSAYDNAKTMVDFYKRFLSVSKIPVPTIAAINGSASGAGLCMTLACDFRIASDKAKLGFTFTKLGIHPGMGCSTLLPRLVNQQFD